MTTKTNSSPVGKMDSNFLIPSHQRTSSIDALNLKSETHFDSEERNPIKLNINEPISDKFDVEDEIFKDENIRLALVRNGNNQYFKYEGPKIPQTLDLVEDLNLNINPRCDIGSFSITECYKKVDEYFRRINKWYDHRGPIALNLESLSLIIVMLIVTIAMSQQTSIPASSPFYNYQSYISSYGGFAVFFFFIYGLVYLSLPPFWAFMLFLVEISVPSYFLMQSFGFINIGAGTPNPIDELVELGIVLLALCWALPYPLVYYLGVEISRIASHSFIALYCIIGLAVAVATPFVNYIQGTSSSPFSSSASLPAIVGLFSVYLWILFHLRYFYASRINLQNLLIHNAKKYARKTLVEKKEDEKKRELHPVIHSLAKNLYWISSIIIGSIFISLMILFSATYNYSQQLGTNSAFISQYLSLTGMTLLPIFMFFGLPTAVSATFKIQNKMLIYPILALIPVGGAVPLFLLSESLNLTDMTFSLFLGPPIGAFFWLGLALVYTARRRVFYFILTFSCIFFLLPLFILGLMASNPIYNPSFTSFLATIKPVTLYTGVAIVSIYLFWNSLRGLFYFLKHNINGIIAFFRQSKINKLIKQLNAFKKANGVINEEETDNLDEPDIAVLQKELQEIQDNHSSKNFVTEKGEDIRDIIYQLIQMLKEKESEKIVIGENFEEWKKQMSLARNKTRTKLLNLIYINLQDFGYWINAASFLTAESFGLYLIFSPPSASTDSSTGMVWGTVVGAPIILVIFNIMIRLRSTKRTENERKSADGKALEKLEADGKDEKRLKRINLVGNLIIIFGFCVNPIVQIIVIVATGSKKWQAMSIYLIVLGILSTIFGLLILKVKIKLGPFHKFFVPVITSTLWLFAIIPFGFVIPILNGALDKSSAEYKTFIEIVMVSSAAFLMLFVTSFAIMLNILLARVEQEKIMKYVTKHLKTLLKENAVKADDLALRRLYENYDRVGAETLEHSLIEDKKPVASIKIAENKRTFAFSHLLMLSETYIILKKKLKKLKLKGEQQIIKKKNCWKKLIIWLTGEDEDDSKDIDTDQMLKEDGKGGAFRIDDYMPDADEHNDEGVWNYVHGDHGMSDLLQEFAERHMNQNEVAVENIDKDVNFEEKDYMTGELEKIQTLELEKNPVVKEFLDEAGEMSPEEIEKWFQVVFEHFAGRIGKGEPKAYGLIFLNYFQFLRISGLLKYVKSGDIEKAFMDNSRKKDKSAFLEYDDFIRVLFIQSQQAFPKFDGEKLLLKLFSVIYPSLMMGVDEINGLFNNHAIHEVAILTYPARLGIFEKKLYAPLPLRMEGKIRAKSPEVKKIKRQFIKVNTDSKSPEEKGILHKKKHGKWFQCLKKAKKKGGELHPDEHRVSQKPSKFKEFLKKVKTALEKVMLACIECLGFTLEIEEEPEVDEAHSGAKKQAPPWPVQVEIMIKNIPAAERVYFEKESTKSLALHFNVPNVSALFGKFMEFYNYMAYAFRAEIPWFSNSNVAQVVTAPTGDSTLFPSYQAFFWAAFGLILIYFVMALRSIRHIRKGTLGENEKGLSAKFPHPQFLLVLGITTLGGSFFINIIKSMIDSFVCDFNGEYPNWPLKIDTSMLCFSNTHMIYLGCAITGILLYYPMSTFLYPNFQFQNKILDLKYLPTWFVFTIQAKLIIVGVISFNKPSSASDSSSINTQLFGTMAVLLFLAIANVATKPCLVKKFNIWDPVFYLISAYVNFAGFIVYNYDNNVPGIIMICLGVPFIFGTGLYISHSLYGIKHQKKKNLRVSEDKVYDDAPQIIFNAELRSPLNNNIEKARMLNAEAEALTILKLKERETEKRMNEETMESQFKSAFTPVDAKYLF